MNGGVWVVDRMVKKKERRREMTKRTKVLFLPNIRVKIRNDQVEKTEENKKHHHFSLLLDV